MFIVSQDRNSVVNMENMTAVYIDGTEKMIMADFTKDAGIDCMVLGRYNEQRTREVFREMLEKVFPPNVLFCNNAEIDPETSRKFFENHEPLVIQEKGADTRIQNYDFGVYYMQEE